MRLQRYLSVCAIVLVSSFTGLRSAEASTIDVKIQSLQYVGQDITISLGDTVRWTNLDPMTHTVTEGFVHPVNGTESFHHSFPPGSQPFSVTFDANFLAAHPKPGNRYNYFCVPHGTAMIGSVTVDTGPGSMYCFCGTTPVCLILDYGAGCPNSTFHGGRMRGAGTAGIGADDLQLVIEQMPLNKTGLVLRGTAQVSPHTFYDGYLCTGGSLYRFPAHNSGATGGFVQGPGIVAATQAGAAPISAGQTWNFQCYYRDSVSLCGNNVNISNGYSVTFVP